MNRATQLLRRMADDSAGEARGTAAELTPIVYDELHDLAAALMRNERVDHTLQPTALVHEAYVKLIDATERPVEGHRTRFFGVAASAMRQVLVDHARRHAAQKRGGGWMRVTLDEATQPQGLTAEEMLTLDDALERLREKKDRLAQVVELRFFCGLTIRDAATVLGVSHTTVEDDWSIARAWLARELANDTNRKRET